MTRNHVSIFSNPLDLPTGTPHQHWGFHVGGVRPWRRDSQDHKPGENYAYYSNETIRGRIAKFLEPREKTVAKYAEAVRAFAVTEFR